MSVKEDEESKGRREERNWKGEREGGERKTKRNYERIGGKEVEV